MWVALAICRQEEAADPRRRQFTPRHGCLSALPFLPSASLVSRASPTPQGCVGACDLPARLAPRHSQVR